MPTEIDLSCLLKTGRVTSVVLPRARIFYTKEIICYFVKNLKIKERRFDVSVYSVILQKLRFSLLSEAIIKTFLRSGNF